MAEQRLIDANALMDVIRQHDYKLATRTGSIDDGMFTLGIQQAVDEALTVEAAPVVHGEWINISEPNADNNVNATCSVCYAGDLHAADIVVPYCWKCGAKMEGK